jgi:toxin-antitoxin system PIN domain toxin
MTLLFPDINVWVALSVSGHRHQREAWRWLESRPKDARLLFARYTQMGLIRLLCNPAAMGTEALTIRAAWAVYDRWTGDARVLAYPEPRGVEEEVRRISGRLGRRAASKWLGDAYLLAFARQAGAALVTFDEALELFGREMGYDVVRPRGA